MITKRFALCFVCLLALTAVGSLFRLFQNEKLPFSGGKPSEPYVRIKIQFGGDVMPAFVNKLTDEQIDRLIAFIRSKK